MTSAALILTLAYVAVAALLLNMNLATRHRAGVKVVAIVLVSALYFGAWHGYRGLMGWPTADPLPEKFRVLWITIDDPDKKEAEPGAINYWVRALDGAGLPVGAPRGHAIPWSEEEAESARAALDAMDEGEILDGHRTRRPLSFPEAVPPATDEAWGARGSVGQDGRRPLFEFMPVAPPTLPAKGDPPGRGASG